ncbi:MAG: OsmC family protein [Halanaerobiales bacterium]
MEVKLEWQGDMEFDSFLPSGHSVKIDASPESGGNDLGPRPMELMLNSVAGCTAIDVVLILDKMDQNLQDFKVEIEGKRAEEHPRVYTHIHLKYILKGDLDEKKVKRAIDLSEEKYCSASNSLKAEITSEYVIE